jgi:hypothetical protein
MDHKLIIPEGWEVASYAEPGTDTGKTKKNLELVKPGPQSGEDDYHSQYVDPEGAFGAAKVGGGETPSYEGPHDKDMNPEGKSGYDVGQLHVEPGEIVVEQGVQHRRSYFLVTHPDEEYFYSVIPKIKSTSEEYKSPKKRTRSEALEMAYKVLNATLPESVSDQMHYTYPETEIVVKSTASQQHM